jgi:drug/metabolite transporter (DMT)-like permease
MKAILALITASFLWGLNFHLLHRMLQETDFIAAGFLRFFFAFSTLCIISFSSLPTLSLIKQHLKGLLWVGLGGLFGFNMFLFWGLKHTSTSNASLLVSLSPILVLLISAAQHRTQLSAVQIIASLISFSGVVLLISKGNPETLRHMTFSKGDLLVLIATLLSALYHIWAKQYALNMSNQHFTLLTNLVCLLAFISISPWGNHFLKVQYSSTFWIVTLTFGTMGTALTYLCWNYGIQQVGSATAGRFMYLVPFFTTIISALLGEDITKIHLASGALILLGLLLQSAPKTRT